MRFDPLGFSNGANGLNILNSVDRLRWARRPDFLDAFHRVLLEKGRGEHLATP